MSKANGAHVAATGSDVGGKAPATWATALLYGYRSGAAGADSRPCSFAPHVAPLRPGAVTAIATPPENYMQHADAADQKHNYPYPKLIVLGILAGTYIALGFSLCSLVGGQLSHDFRLAQPGVFNLLFGIYGFPMGLTLCVVAGADLFTSNCMYTTIGVAEGRYGLLGAVRCLFTSYFCNLMGALLLMGLMVAGNVFHGREEFVIEMAMKKVSSTFGATLVKGMLCNWLVCLAVWQGNMARDLTGKFVGIFLPNSAFVSMGFEHCIANMYLIPLSMCLGSGISVGTFIGRNLIPATIGNLIGGSLFVGVAYACSFGTPGHAIGDMWDAALNHVGVQQQHDGKPSTLACSVVASGREPPPPADRTESFCHVRSGLQPN